MNGFKYHYPHNDRYIKLNSTQMITFIKNYQSNYNLSTIFKILLDTPEHIIIRETVRNIDTNITFWIKWDFYLNYYYRTESLYPM